MKPRDTLLGLLAGALAISVIVGGCLAIAHALNF